MFQHLIFTRFNLPYDAPTPKSNLDPAWLQARAQLFETYCLPSLCRQTNQHFRWLLLFDDRTPKRFRHRVQKWVEQCPQLEPQWLDCTTHFQPLMKYLCKENCYGYQYVITTRIDSDDCLGDTYIELIQKAVPAMPDHREFLSFPKGLQYIAQQDAYFTLRYPYNHFLSLVESTDNPDGVLYFDHRYVAKAAPVRFLSAKRPQWTQVVHGGNLANAFEPRLRPFPVDTSRKGWQLYARLWKEYLIVQFKRLPSRFRQHFTHN